MGNGLEVGTINLMANGVDYVIETVEW